MTQRTMLYAMLLAAGALISLRLSPAHAEDITTHCSMTYSMSGWSALYKIAKGTGMVNCNNGQSLKVALKSEGGGLTAGKSTIDNGHGEFTGVHDITDVLGDYATGGAHAGAVKSAAAGVVTKGDVSLALSGTGRGIDLGVDFGKFTISSLPPEAPAP